MLERARKEVRALHARALGWDPPDVDAGRVLSTTRIRQHVRRLINEWDLLRLYPDYAPNTVVAELPMDYSVRPELEATEEATLDDGKPV
jgi:hypothetical protein